MATSTEEANVFGVIKIAVMLVVAIVGLWIIFHTVSVIRVEGNEALVQQDWNKGVVSQVLLSGTHFYSGWTTEMFKYNVGTQKATFDSQETNKDPQFERIVVDCGENGGQKAWIAMSINYRLGWEMDEAGNPVFSPEKLVKFHKDGLRSTYEQVVLKRTVVDVVNKIARPHEALEIYSGKGFVAFKEAIDKELKGHHGFRDRGILIENTIIYKVYLDPAYEAEIAQKVLAIQTTLKKQQQTLAAQEEAKRVFAEAGAKVEQMRQDSEAQKIKMVKQAEADNEREILAAKADKIKQVLSAEGLRDANLANASGVLALGKAEAEVSQLKTNALYAGEGGSRRASIELATAQAEKLKGLFSGVQIVPEKTILSVGGSNLVVNPSDSQQKQ